MNILQILYHVHDHFLTSSDAANKYDTDDRTEAIQIHIIHVCGRFVAVGLELFTQPAHHQLTHSL